MANFTRSRSTPFLGGRDLPRRPRSMSHGWSWSMLQRRSSSAANPWFPAPGSWSHMLPVNVGLRLSATATQNPAGKAVVMPVGYNPDGKRGYDWVTFRELDDDSNLLADGLREMGVRP